MVKIWEFHRFSDDCLMEIYPEGVEGSSSLNTDPCEEPIETLGSIDNRNLDPMEALSEYLEKQCQSTLEYVKQATKDRENYWLQEFKE
jgi:hypothetical protein